MRGFALVLFFFLSFAVGAQSAVNSSEDARGSNGTQPTVLQQGGFTVELLENDVPQTFVVRHGVPKFTVHNPHRTSLRVRNTTSERVQIVFTFNRFNPMTGRLAVMGDNGFVLDPQQSLTITLGRLSKRKTDKPVELFATHPAGSFHFAFFKERSDYPLILPNMEPPPYGPENFVTENGVRRWVPPARYPFRRVQDMPNFSVFATYSGP